MYRTAAGRMESASAYPSFLFSSRFSLWFHRLRKNGPLERMYSTSSPYRPLVFSKTPRCRAYKGGSGFCRKSGVGFRQGNHQRLFHPAPLRQGSESSAVPSLTAFAPLNDEKLFSQSGFGAGKHRPLYAKQEVLCGYRGAVVPLRFPQGEGVGQPVVRHGPVCCGGNRPPASSRRASPLKQRRHHGDRRRVGGNLRIDLPRFGGQGKTEVFPFRRIFLTARKGKDQHGQQHGQQRGGRFFFHRRPTERAVIGVLRSSSRSPRRADSRLPAVRRRAFYSGAAGGIIGIQLRPAAGGADDRFFRFVRRWKPVFQTNGRSGGRPANKKARKSNPFKMVALRGSPKRREGEKVCAFLLNVIIP